MTMSVDGQQQETNRTATATANNATAATTKGQSSNDSNNVQQ